MTLDPIIIVGCPRSGTSLTGRILYACGAWAGNSEDLREGNCYNPGGYFENARLMHDLYYNYVLKQIAVFENFGDGVRPKSHGGHHSTRQDALKFIRDKLGHKIPENSAWFIKAIPYLAYSDDLPIWTEVFPNAKWIITNRDHRDVFNSLCLFDNGAEDKPLLRQILSKHEKLMSDLRGSNAQQFEIWPFRSIGECDPDLNTYQELVEWCGLEWNDTIIRQFINPSLCHNHEDPQGISPPCL